MNLAFELQKDNPLREDGMFQLFRPVSLWDMLRFCATKFVDTITFLARCQKPGSISDYLKQGEDSRLWFVSLLKDLRQKLIDMELTNSVAQIDRLLLDLKFDSKRKWSPPTDVEKHIEKLIERVIDELQGKLFLMVPLSRAPSYNEADTFLGRDLIIQFPDIIEDACEAGNCFALQRYTACVFHLMLITERFVHRFGRKRKIKISDLHKKPWGQILNELQPKIIGMPQKTLVQQRQKDRYHDCYRLLVAINRSLRTPTMHATLRDLRSTYTEEQAKEVKQHVKQFVENFPTLR